MAIETQLSLRYEGPAVQAGLMDVYQASANMIAFSEFVVAAAKATFGSQVEARAQVAGFGRGSFVTDLVFNVGGPVASIFSAMPADHILRVIAEAVQLWKHLKGQPPQHVEQTNNSQQVRVTNNDGKIIQVNAHSVQLVFSENAAHAAEKFIREPLQRGGVDGVEIAAPKERQQIARVSENEADYFVAVAPSEKVTDVTVRMSLIIEAPVFKEDNKWRFTDGQQSFYASMEDREFLARVDSGERFGKGDVLVVDLRITQERSGLTLSAERAVLKVHEHRAGSEQRTLFS